LLEDGIHELDVIHWLIGARVARVYAAGGNSVLKDRQTIDHAAIVIEYESGVKVDFGFSLFAPNSGPAGREILVIGSEGNLQPTRPEDRPASPNRRRAANDRGRRSDPPPSAPAPRAKIKTAAPTGSSWRLWKASARGRSPSATGRWAGKRSISRWRRRNRSGSGGW